MKIDWFTLIAQIVNFVVLVWLLKHFLYARITNAMTEREAGIAGRLASAARLRSEAEQERALYQSKIEELDERREQILEQARRQSESQGQALIAAAHQKADLARQQWFETLKREQQEVLQDFRERLGQQVFSIVRRVLSELANAGLEQEMLKVFLEKLRNTETERERALMSAIRSCGNRVDVRTTYALPPDVQAWFTSSLRDVFGEGLLVQYLTIPDLICGLELRAQSQRLDWNFETYMVGLEDHVFQVMEESAARYATTS